jgi:hypothetical protein
VSYNGSAWKRAQDALYAGVARNAALNASTAATIFPWDAVASDSYGLFNTGTYKFSVPLAGIYELNVNIGLNTTAANQTNLVQLANNSLAFFQVVVASIASAAETPNFCRQLINIAPANTPNNLWVNHASNTAGLAIAIPAFGVSQTTCQFRYVGTGGYL